MQNKPNYKDAQMNATSNITRDYENISDWTLGENKPNSNPIKPNLRKAQMNVNSLITKDYRKKDDFTVRINKPNSNPISVKAKMNANTFSQKDYENEPPSGSKKTNPIKANFPASNLRRLLITLFGFGYAVFAHSGSIYFQCAYSCSASILEKKQKNMKK